MKRVKKHRDFVKKKLMEHVPIGKENAQRPAQFAEKLEWFTREYLSALLGEMAKDMKIARVSDPTPGSTAFLYYIPNFEEKKKSEEKTQLPGLERAIKIWDRANDICSRIDTLDDAMPPTRNPAAVSFKDTLCYIVRQVRNDLIRANMSGKIINYLVKKGEDDDKRQ